MMSLLKRNQTKKQKEQSRVSFYLCKSRLIIVTCFVAARMLWEDKEPITDEKSTSIPGKETFDSSSCFVTIKLMLDILTKKNPKTQIC